MTESANKHPAFNLSIENSIAELTLSRPQTLNMLDEQFWLQFPATVEKLSAQAQARALIFSSTGKHFTAGMDLQVFRNMADSFRQEPARRAEQMRRWVLRLQRAATSLETARMPVIAAIQGGCIGGGVDLICAADMRFCTKDAFFSIKEVAIAITADLGTLQRVESVMPAGLARELAFTGRNMDAQEALSCGFVNRVFSSQEEMMNHINKLAKTIAGHSPVAVTGTKQMLNYRRDHSTADSLDYMATWQAGMLQMPDVLEAMNSATEKRPTNFDDLLPENN